MIIISETRILPLISIKTKTFYTVTKANYVYCVKFFRQKLGGFNIKHLRRGNILQACVIHTIRREQYLTLNADAFDPSQGIS